MVSERMSSSQLAVASSNLRKGIPIKIGIFGGDHDGLSFCFVAFGFSIEVRGRPEKIEDGT